MTMRRRALLLVCMASAAEAHRAAWSDGAAPPASLLERPQLAKFAARGLGVLAGSAAAGGAMRTRAEAEARPGQRGRTALAAASPKPHAFRGASFDTAFAIDRTKYKDAGVPISPPKV